MKHKRHSSVLDTKNPPDERHKNEASHCTKNRSHIVFYNETRQGGVRSQGFRSVATVATPKHWAQPLVSTTPPLCQCLSTYTWRGDPTVSERRVQRAYWHRTAAKLDSHLQGALALLRQAHKIQSTIIWWCCVILVSQIFESRKLDGHIEQLILTSPSTGRFTPW